MSTGFRKDLLFLFYLSASITFCSWVRACPVPPGQQATFPAMLVVLHPDTDPAVWPHPVSVRGLVAFRGSLSSLVAEPGLYLTQYIVELHFITVMSSSNVNFSQETVRKKLGVLTGHTESLWKPGVTSVSLCSSDLGLVKAHLSDPRVGFARLHHPHPPTFTALRESEKSTMESHFMTWKGTGKMFQFDKYVDSEHTR